MKRLLILFAVLVICAAAQAQVQERAVLVTQTVFNRVIAKTAACTSATYSIGYYRYHSIGYARAHKDDSCSVYVRLQVSSRPDSSGGWVEWDTLWASTSRTDTLVQGRGILGTFSMPPEQWIRFIGEGRSDNGTNAFLKFDYVAGS